ncbi:MAG: hypothetical protein O7F71_20445, partial [Gammaproteobacteria bacterium]|nr:hypothetical protein [Gammaproteobacteria bacterium]
RSTGNPRGGRHRGHLALMREILSDVEAEILTAVSGKQAIEIAMNRDDQVQIVVEDNGIGLATVKKIVERHSGAIEAHGIEGQGATFTITLPASSNEIGEVP